MENKRKPTEQQKEVLLFLNDLRDSGETNMFGARPYIEAEFPNIDKSETSKLLFLWMKNFDATGEYELIFD